ncbi:hypothetical protein DUG83_23585 [Vibrio parahaemolyticus]|nr:hypothetical protein [Vibrio parahaemolyticus]
MFKLGRVRIENFKSFIDVVSLDFTNQDLVIFDGPNGFGKTTIFDAIELCFTGKVSRVNPTDSKVKKTHILKGDNSKHTSIKIELLYDGKTSLVIEAVIPANISGNEGKVNNYINTIKRFESNKWDFDTSEAMYLNEDKLKSTLGNERIDSTFTLFNYIQQEETCHFLKLGEIERHKQISYLFGTSDETNRSNKLDLLSKKIKERIDNYYTPIIEREEKALLNLSKPTLKEESGDIQVGSGKLAALRNLDDLTVEQLAAYISNLEGVSWVINNKESFEDLKFNYLIKKITNERVEAIKNFIKVGVANDYKEIEKLRSQYLSWKKTSEKANTYKKLVNIFELKPKSLTKDYLNEYKNIFSKECSKFSLDIAEFEVITQSSDTFSKVLASIEDSRKDLMVHYGNHIGHENKNDNLPCPLCGDGKSNWNELIKEYDIQTKRFEEQLGENGRLLATVTKKLIDELIFPLVSKMKRFLNHYDLYINYEFEEIIKSKFIDKQDYESMLLVRSWLNDNIDGCTSYQDKNIRDYKVNYNEVTEQLISFIDSSAKVLNMEVPKSYTSFTKDLRSLDGILTKDGNIAVDSNDVSKDILLLTRISMQKSSVAYKEKEKTITKLKADVEKLSLKRKELMDIRTIYIKEIKAYEKDIAKHIAIPLFIYSSKLLQSRPEGSGVFLVTPDTDRAQGFMQFSATPNDSHDAWNTMSSGQLSGVVISFMLAMNKVYPSNLSTLLIDDPVQTMDEVNMASFVQMMKYEFPKTQMLLSTHETKVASYFNYKYNEAGLRTLPINMKNKRLEFSS